MPEVEFARDTQNFVELFLQMGVSHQWFYRLMIGRLHYAAHHLGRRVLSEAGLQPDEWRENVHQRVLEGLYQHHVRTGAMSLETWRGLQELVGLRRRADYSLLWRCRLRDVNRAVAVLNHFADECHRILEGKANGPERNSGSDHP